MATSGKNELEELEAMLQILRTPVPAAEEAAQTAEIKRLAMYLDELLSNRGFVL